MIVYIKIITIFIVITGFLLLAGCRNLKQSGESNNTATIDSDISTMSKEETTSIQPVEGSETTSINETTDKLIESINGADSLDRLLDVYKKYTNRIDGAYAEAYSYNLLRFYREIGALDFIKALAARGWSYINVNSEFLAGEVFIHGGSDAVSALETDVEAVKSKTDLSSMELNTLTTMLGALEPIQIINEAVYNAEKSDFTIWKSLKSISLYDKEDVINLQDILGKAKSKNIEQLGSGSDTFSGSFIKELSYDGIKLRLFAPKGDEEAFWIYSIVVIEKDFTTAKGIGVENSVLEMKQQYPNIKQANDGRNDENNCAYEIIKNDEYLYLTFEIKDGKIAEIKMIVEFP